MNERERIGSLIASLRKEKGLTQVQFSELTGIGRGHLVRIEQGRYDVKLETLEKIAKGLGKELNFTEPQ